ncbi:MAG: cob(II)yrinic acid a,c-diamide reductase [Acidimicrobiaceae bacterium]|nr:cob(II)yrinic acid a,c-diamide reductase [Acidimicrobiaceae bacterium]
MSWPRPVPLVGDTTSAAERRAEPTAWRFDEGERAALYSVIAARRDIRRFRPDPLDPAVLRRLLGAAHAAPSVGHSQPWRFVLVTDPAIRECAAVIAERERLRQAGLLAEDASRRMLDLKLDGIREAPIGIVVCCDRRVEATGVLGRATFPDADLWSCVLAIENLWLSARSEGLGLGWVTLFPPRELAALVELPAGVETLGWLCLGWPDERPPAPGLERAGWSRRLPLDAVILNERWPGAGPKPPESHLRAPEPAAIVTARDESDLLLTPPGSLGALDQSLERLGALGILQVPEAILVLAAADHPVASHGVSTYPTEVTREVFQASVARESLGAAAAGAVGMRLVLVDAGINGGPIGGTLICRPRGRRGDLVHEDALDSLDLNQLIGFGRQVGLECCEPIVAIGELGIGNTTVAAALASILLELDPLESVGLGAGGDAATLERKVHVVRAAVERARRGPAADGRDPRLALAAVGGPELAVLTGVVLGVAGRGGAVILDGFATALAALCAVRIEPAVTAHLIAGQRSREQGHRAVLDELGLEPLLDLRLRAGEGVGAVFATQLLLTALRTREASGRVVPG